MTIKGQFGISPRIMALQETDRHSVSTRLWNTRESLEQIGYERVQYSHLDLVQCGNVQMILEGVFRADMLK